MIISRGVGGILGQKLAVLRYRRFEIAGVSEIHGQPVAGKRVPRILRQHRFENFSSVHICMMLLYACGVPLLLSAGAARYPRVVCPAPPSAGRSSAGRMPGASRGILSRA